jgi:predicted ArsR family transcriptional regulator
MSHSRVKSAEVELRSVDRDLLLAMRDVDSVGIGDLTESLGVTATAVRQRIDRLLQMGLIEREKKSVPGRGRPTYRYRLTLDGHRRVAANATALAEAMWGEILAIQDDHLRAEVIEAIGSRLGREYASQIESEIDGASLEQRIQKLAEMMSERQIDSEVTQLGQLPVLDIGSCPYPSLTDASADRAMCRLEEQMISAALGQPVHLSSCRLDGDACCQFSAESPSPAQSQ